MAITTELMVIKAAYSVTFDLFNFSNNVSIFQEHNEKLNFRYTFYQFCKFKQIISNYWRDANNYQQEKRTPVL